MLQFDRQLIELKAFAPTPEIKSTYGEMKAVWSDYKTALIGQVPKRESAQSLVDIDGKLRLLANKGASGLEQLDELDQARNQWVFYDSALTLKAGESAAPQRGANVFASSENILSVMEKVTALYVRAGA